MMIAKRGTKPKNTVAKTDKGATIKKTKVETKLASPWILSKERSLRELEEALLEAKKALRDAQTQIKYEHKARIKAEKALAKAEQASVKKYQAQLKRVSFIVRVEVDEQGQPRRTEIEDVQSRIKENFLGLDGEQLVAFVEKYIRPAIASGHAIPAVPLPVHPAEMGTSMPKAIIKSCEALSAPSGNIPRSTEALVDRKAPAQRLEEKRGHSGGKKTRHPRRQQFNLTAPQVVMPVERSSNSPEPMSRQLRPKASLIVSDVQVFHLATPEFATSTLTPEEPFIVQAHFQFLGSEARSLITKKSSCEIRVYAKEITSGRSMLLTTYSAELIQNILEYAAPVEIPGLSLGLYRLFIVVTLRVPIKIGGGIKTFIWVI